MSPLDLPVTRQSKQLRHGNPNTDREIMSAKRKSWREKLADSKGFPKVAKIDCTKSKRWGEGTFVIPAPLEVDAVMKKVGRGKLITIDAIRKLLAKKHGTT